MIKASSTTRSVVHSGASPSGSGTCDRRSVPSRARRRGDEGTAAPRRAVPTPGSHPAPAAIRPFRAASTFPEADLALRFPSLAVRSNSARRRNSNGPEPAEGPGRFALSVLVRLSPGGPGVGPAPTAAIRTPPSGRRSARSSPRSNAAGRSPSPAPAPTPTGALPVRSWSVPFPKTADPGHGVICRVAGVPPPPTVA